MPGFCLPVTCCGCGAGLGAAAAAWLQPVPYAVSTNGLGRSAASREAKQKKRDANTVDRDCEWLNDLLIILWPRINKYLKNLVEEKILPAVNQALPHTMRGSIKVEKLSMGESTPRFSSFDVILREDQAIVLDLQVDVVSDLDIEIRALKVPVGIRAFNFHGALTVCLLPPAVQPPFFSGVEVYFVNPPELDIEFKGAAHIADFKGLRGVIHDTILKIISDQLVIPACISVDLFPTEHTDDVGLRWPEPLGVLRVQVRSATELRADDFSFNGKTSDPYVAIALGLDSWRSKTLPKTTSPVWPQSGPTSYADFLVYNKHQLITFKVFDEDLVSQDDLLGEVRGISVERLMTAKTVLHVFSLTCGGSAAAGSLTVSTRFYTLTKEAPVQAICPDVAAGPTHFVLTAKVEDGIGFPVDGHTPFHVRISVTEGGKEYSASSGPSTGPERKVRASKELQHVCLELARRRLAAEEICAITGLVPQQVKFILSQDGDPDALRALAKRAAATNPTFRQVLRLSLRWTPEMMHKAELTLEILDSRQRPVGKPFRIKVEAVASQEQRGPFDVGAGAMLSGSLSVKWLQLPLDRAERL